MNIPFNRVKFSTATTGTGSVTVGSAVTKFRTPAQASIPSGTALSLLLEDGNDWEVSDSVITGTTLTRVLVDSSTGSLLTLSGSATVSVIAGAADIAPRIGEVRNFAINPGAGYLACDGAIYTQSSYSALATALGTRLDYAPITPRISTLANAPLGGVVYTLNAVCYVSSSTFVAVGTGGTIIRSTDAGVTWAAVTSNVTVDLLDVKAGGSWVVAVGNGGTIVTSSDSGATWTTRTSGVTPNITCLAFGNSLFVAGVANTAGGSVTAIQAADPTSTWSSAGAPNATTNATANTLTVAGIVYGSGTSQWAAVTITGTSIYYTTTLSGTWTAFTAFGNMNRIIYTLGLFIVGISSGASVATSANAGTTFTSRATGTGNVGVTSLASDGTTALFLGKQPSSADNGYAHATSTNGTSWTNRASTFIGGPANADGPNAVAVGNGTWVAVGPRGMILTSSDALAWVNRSLGFSGGFVTTGATDGTTYVLAGITGGAICTTDLVNWKPCNIGIYLVRHVVYGNSMFVAVGSSTSDTVTAIRTSTTPATGIWTAVTPTGFVGLIQRICWTGSLWVATSSTGGIFTSPDLTTWTARTVPITVTNFTGIACNGAVVVAGGNYTGGVLRSTDHGATWSLVQTSPSSYVDVTPRTLVLYHANSAVWFLWPLSGSAAFLISTDNGVSWQYSDKIPSPTGGVRFTSTTNGIVTVTGKDGAISGAADSILSHSADGLNWNEGTPIFGEYNNLIGVGAYLFIGNNNTSLILQTAPERSYNPATQFVVPRSKIREASSRPYVYAGK